MPRLTRVVAAMATVGLAALIASPVSAHAFGQRYDLPIPLNYFLIGAVAAVALSFVVLGMFVQRSAGQINYPRLNLLRVPAVGPILSSRFASTILRVLSVAIFALLVVAGFFGTARPIENISPTFIWIIWWVGTGYVVALVGNVWMAVNPWKITFEWYQRLTGSRNGRESPPFKYPEGLDVWPALVLFFVFAWAENVFTGAFRPMTLSVMVILYSVVMWTGMAAFGKHTWLRHGEAFTVLFGLFSRFSPTEVRVTDRRVCRRCDSDCAEESECIDCHECFEQAGDTDRELNLRPFAVGLALRERVSTATAAFVILALSSVTFDGFQDTQTWAGWRADMLAVASADVVDTLALAAVPPDFRRRVPGLLLGNLCGVRRAFRRDDDRAAVRVLAGADRARVQPRALHYAAVDSRAAHHSAGIGPVRVRLGPVRHLGVQDPPEDHKRQDRLVPEPRRYRGRSRALRVPCARDLPTPGSGRLERSQGPDTDAGAHAAVHGEQPVDHRTADSGAEVGFYKTVLGRSLVGSKKGTRTTSASTMPSLGRSTLTCVPRFQWDRGITARAMLESRFGDQNALVT